MADTEHMLSTKDNPYNPWTDFDAWQLWDEREGKHNTLSLLARVTRTSDEVPDEMMGQDIETAIQEIVDYNVSGVHIMVPKPKDLES